MRKSLVLCSIVGLVIAVVLAGLWLSKPKVERRRAPPESKIIVRSEVVEPKTIRSTVQSYGVVRPLTSTQLISRVSGEVETINDAFREGGAFKAGDVLLRIEQADYQIALQQARAQVAEAESRLINEQALAEEAKSDWRRSGRTGEPPELALRKPQLRAAEAALTSAQAAFERADLNLQRTVISAPYDGRVSDSRVDKATVVSAGTVLGHIFSTNFAEVVLPIKAKDLHLLPKPPYGVGEVPVKLASSQSGKTWTGYLSRMSPAIDPTSRLATVIARIPDPFSVTEQPLMVGEYVTATIQGLPIDNAIYVENSAIYQGSYLYVYQDGKVYRQDVSIGWFDQRGAIINQGLEAGDILITTPLGRIVSGTPVNLEGASDEPQGHRKGRGNKKVPGNINEEGGLKPSKGSES